MEYNLWIIGRNVEGKGAWDFLGVFDNKIEAIKHAISMKDDSHFVGPALLNERLPEGDSEPWPDAFYPKILKLWYDSTFEEGDWDITAEELLIANKEKDNILKAYEENINNGNRSK